MKNNIEDQLKKSVDKKPKMVFKEVEYDEKINWAKLIKAILKILEPHIKKMNPAWILVPIAFLYFTFSGMYHSIMQIINLF